MRWVLWDSCDDTNLVEIQQGNLERWYSNDTKFFIRLIEFWIRLLRTIFIKNCPEHRKEYSKFFRKNITTLFFHPVSWTRKLFLIFHIKDTVFFEDKVELKKLYFILICWICYFSCENIAGKLSATINFICDYRQENNQKIYQLKIAWNGDFRLKVLTWLSFGCSRP